MKRSPIKKCRIFPTFFVSKPKLSEGWHIIKGGEPLNIIKGLPRACHHGAAEYKTLRVDDMCNSREWTINAYGADDIRAFA